VPPDTVNLKALFVQIELLTDAGVTASGGLMAQFTAALTVCCGELESRKLNVVVPLPLASPEICVKPPEAGIDAGLIPTPAVLETTVYGGVPPEAANWKTLPEHDTLSIDVGVTASGVGAGTDCAQLISAEVVNWGLLLSTIVMVVLPGERLETALAPPETAIVPCWPGGVGGENSGPSAFG
jgi:hypothetical protein